jgi:hypothetical protein
MWALEIADITGNFLQPLYFTLSELSRSRWYMTDFRWLFANIPPQGQGAHRVSCAGLR